uniref:Uncharacterized protein n=1 Tax=Panagrellus redivivus TaxID=6233 RepID=A0A7E4VXB0_PANRE
MVTQGWLLLVSNQLRLKQSAGQFDLDRGSRMLLRRRSSAPRVVPYQRPAIVKPNDVTCPTTSCHYVLWAPGDDRWSVAKVGRLIASGHFPSEMDTDVVFLVIAGCIMMTGDRADCPEGALWPPIDGMDNSQHEIDG